MTSSRDYDLVIVGAGVVGCALAKELAHYDLSVGVLEQSRDVCEGTSKANTAILHTGFDCVPGSLESKLVARGYELLDAYADQTGIAVERCGALLVAWTDEQREALPKIQEKAVANGYEDTRLLSADEIALREPHLGSGIFGGLEVPGESIIDPWSTPLAFALEAVNGGVSFHFSTQLLGVETTPQGHLLSTTSGEFRTRWLVNAAGLSSGIVNELCHHHDFTVTPRRGELLVFDKLARQLVNSIILPVPTAQSKGVLVSPTVFGNVLLGPTADDIDDPRATATTESGIDRLWASGERIIPSLLEEEVTAAYAGLRAATAQSDYQIHLHEAERYVCVGGIRSTGLTGSLAIAEHVASLLERGGCSLGVRSDEPVASDVPVLGEQQRRPFEDPERIRADVAYGRILCHCERVTEGEIRDACSGPLPAVDLGGLRRRTRAMNGRCQGFFCAANVVEVMAQLTGASVAELTGLEP